MVQDLDGDGSTLRSVVGVVVFGNSFCTVLLASGRVEGCTPCFGSVSHYCDVVRRVIQGCMKRQIT